MISTGGTIAESVRALLEAKARPEIVVAATHGLLLPGARRKLEEAPVQEVYVTDTVPPVEQDWSRLRVVSVAPLIAAAIERSLADGSTGDDSR
jgi:ribose-phosphate pyrophosphokinase